MEIKIENLSKKGRKGGARFPNNSLKQMIPFLKDLISKTHSKPISIEQLNAGVFKVKPNSAEGGVKYSSLKQYGLAEGEYSNITSTELASALVLASDEERSHYFRQAIFNAAIFKNTFETFQDSSVHKSKIKNYSVSTLNVHIDLADKFLKSFLDSCEIAKLCSLKGDEVSFIGGKDVLTKKNNDEEKNSNEDLAIDEDESIEDPNDSLEDKNDNSIPFVKNNNPKTNKANIDLKIDPTLDADKLEKQLRVLRKYGLI